MPDRPTAVPDLTTVADDEAVLHDGSRVVRVEGLAPASEHEAAGVPFRTLPRPPGARLATVATVNDLHFGETECGVVEGLELGPIFCSKPGEEPYPELMNRAAVSEIATLGPDAVVAKGDLTADGTLDQYQRFLDVYRSAFGERLVHVRGNHDAHSGLPVATAAPLEMVLPGVVLAVLDTVVPGHSGGRLSADQLEWLDELGARADRPVLVFGHHHVHSPESPTRHDTYFGINPDDSDRLVAVVARRPSIAGYFAGHTHRNRVRRFAVTGRVPWVEVACVKDFPGSWAEYRIHEGGILQVHRRISAPEALAWSERTRGMFGGLYPAYAFGTLDDRCFLV